MSKGIVNAGSSIAALLARAYGAERTRICHVLKALECAQDAELRELWRKRLELARSRAGMLARMLARCEEDAPAVAPHGAGDCLLDAMELALRNGDLVAAEAVARECVALADVQCARAWRELDEALSEANAVSVRIGSGALNAASVPDTTAH
ncbi:MAG TPA: hypothetical protein VJ722_00550 [Rhodanobacteraceae bacterium]|nr:hypothetical protein [Rhodanobacteraceae bacterium]